jgi:sterol desaturase/sphingolipid hydroxylase (fatty acid hydroxylase superfamily)
MYASLIYAAPVIFLLMLLEAWYSQRKALALYVDLRDAAASLAMGLGNTLLSIPVKLLFISALFLAYDHRILELDFSASPWLWLLLIPAEDLCYYWKHRAGHRVRVFWAGHVNHHSSEQYNLSTALRQTWPGAFYGFVFWIPLAFLGVHPILVLTAKGINLLYQYWIHTQAIDRLPRWFEYVFNTPSHHRVHHGSNPQYVDKNYGGIFILWDRLFGTFQEEDEKVVYGLIKNINTYNPLKIAFHAWGNMLADMRAAKTLREKLLIPIREPAWYSEQLAAQQGEVKLHTKGLTDAA